MEQSDTGRPTEVPPPTLVSLDIKPARIGGGWPYFILGWILVFFGFAYLGSSDGTDAAFGGVFTMSVGSGFIAVGFWLSIAHKIELRLIDLQKELTRVRLNV